jgi:hypothetical protein
MTTTPTHFLHRHHKFVFMHCRFLFHFFPRQSKYFLSDAKWWKVATKNKFSEAFQPFLIVSPWRVRRGEILSRKSNMHEKLLMYIDGKKSWQKFTSCASDKCFMGWKIFFFSREKKTLNEMK